MVLRFPALYNAKFVPTRDDVFIVWIGAYVYFNFQSLLRIDATSLDDPVGWLTATGYGEVFNFACECSGNVRGLLIRIPNDSATKQCTHSRDWILQRLDTIFQVALRLVTSNGALLRFRNHDRNALGRHHAALIRPTCLAQISVGQDDFQDIFQGQLYEVLTSLTTFRTAKHLF